MIKNLCHELGVHTEPMRISGVWIAPIYSWYHASFDREPDVPGAPAVEKVIQHVTPRSGRRFAPRLASREHSDMLRARACERQAPGLL